MDIYSATETFVISTHSAPLLIEDQMAYKQYEPGKRRSNSLVIYHVAVKQLRSSSRNMLAQCFQSNFTQNHCQSLDYMQPHQKANQGLDARCLV